MLEKITDNKQKIKQNKVLPYLVGNVVEVRLLPSSSSSPSLPSSFLVFFFRFRSSTLTLRMRTMEL